MERIAVCPGSFDPVTLGHIDIITRAAALFDRVIVLVSKNVDKHPVFTADERVGLIKKALPGIKNVAVESFDGLLADYVREKKACAIVKGIRAMTDFENEFQMALVNRKLYGEAETVFLVARSENMYLSSSVVRQIASFGGDIESFVPKEIAGIITERLYKNQEAEK